MRACQNSPRPRPDFAFPLPEKCIRTTNRGNACGVDVVPWGPHSCYVGASNLVTRYYEPTRKGNVR